MIDAQHQATFDYLFGAAHKALSEGRSFAPFATSVDASGVRLHFSADLPAAISAPGEHIAALIATLADRAATDGFSSAGLVFDATLPLENGVVSDAVCVHSELASGDAVQVFIGYKRGKMEKPAFAPEPFVHAVPARIFAKG